MSKCVICKGEYHYAKGVYSKEACRTGRIKRIAEATLRICTTCRSIDNRCPHCRAWNATTEGIIDKPCKCGYNWEEK